MIVSMNVVHGSDPLIVRAATPCPFRRNLGLSRQIDVSDHLQMGSTISQARVHRESEGRFWGFEAVPFEPGSTQEAYVSSISCDCI